MDPGHYENEDSNHEDVNGWIKKEIEDDEFEDYIKQTPDIESGDRYEELMNLTKDDLVGRILQQEEDIRYLQDLRHGLEKNVQDLTMSCSEFKKLLKEMTSVLSSVKDNMPMVSSPPPAPAQSSRPQTARSSSSSANPAVASPRSTPNPYSAPSPSPRSSSGVMGSANVRSTPSSSSSQQPGHIAAASSVVTTDRMHSGGSGKTVTITRSTNVVIKTEIPSPPPQQEQPMISHQPQNPTVVASSHRSRSDGQRQYQMRQQQQIPRSSPMSSSSMNISSVPSHGRNMNQAGNMNMQFHHQPHQQQQQRGRMGNQPVHFTNAASGANTRSASQMQRNMASNAFQRQQQQHHQQQQRVTQSNVQQSHAGFTAGRGHKAGAQQVRQDMQFAHAASRQSPAMQSPNSSSGPTTRQRVSAQPVQAGSSTPAPKCTVAEVTENVPVKMPSGITLPSGLTLSIVTPRSVTETKPQQPVVEKAVISSTVSKTPTESSGSATPEESSSVPKNSEKNISSSNVTNTSNAVSTTSATPMEEDEDEEFYDEVAVLEPDKSSSPAMDTSGGQAGGSSADAQVSSASSDGFNPAVEQSPESYWNSQNQSNRGEQKTVYQNNDEYMFEEADDIESGEENDTKIYLGENVSLPKDLVDSCIKQGPTPAKLTRNLMQALFPDLREIASGCNDGSGDSSGPTLPSNKLNAIIAQVQKVFPQTKRAQIVLTMNMKCREARTQLTKNRRAHVQYSPY